MNATSKWKQTRSRSPGGADRARAFAVRYLLETARSPVGLFWSFAFPAVWYLITAHLGGASGLEPAAAPAAKAVLWVAFGVFGALTVTLVGVAGDVAEDIDAKRYGTLRSRPVAPSADLGGRFAAAGLTPLAVEVTTRDVREVGWRVARVVVPELLDLSLPSLPPVHHPSVADGPLERRPHPYP